MTGGWRRAARLPALLVVAVLRGYQLLLSPLVGPVCRYAPSCSSYAVEAVRGRGLVVGLLLAARRLLRCHPWAPGGWDPVPPRRARSSAPRHPAPGHTGHHDERLPGRDRADPRPLSGRTP